jgi:alkyl sulfatase BDS1-like metallo-beta-lactamase superfamily hydrolase
MPAIDSRAMFTGGRRPKAAKERTRGDSAERLAARWDRRHPHVEMMGGAEKIIARGRQLHDEGSLLLAQEILNKLVQAEPQNQTAKDLLADIFEQIDYQQENPGLRNSFLAGAYELRSGIPKARPSTPAARTWCERCPPNCS